MATITKRRSGKWCAQIRSHNKYISKTFIKKSNASAWAKEIVKFSGHLDYFIL